jgi:hypothetical protein
MPLPPLQPPPRGAAGRRPPARHCLPAPPAGRGPGRDRWVILPYPYSRTPRSGPRAAAGIPQPPPGGPAVSFLPAPAGAGLPWPAVLCYADGRAVVCCSPGQILPTGMDAMSQAMSLVTVLLLPRLPCPPAVRVEREDHASFLTDQAKGSPEHLSPLHEGTCVPSADGTTITVTLCAETLTAAMAATAATLLTEHLHRLWTPAPLPSLNNQRYCVSARRVPANGVRAPGTCCPPPLGPPSRTAPRSPAAPGSHAPAFAGTRIRASARFAPCPPFCRAGTEFHRNQAHLNISRPAGTVRAALTMTRYHPVLITIQETVRTRASGPAHVERPAPLGSRRSKP